MIKFITDSSADIPIELMREFDIRAVPTHIIWGDQQFADRNCVHDGRSPTQFHQFHRPGCRAGI